MPPYPASRMCIAAVVVTYNRKALLLECLAALARQTHPLERILVVDNASTDGTPAALAGCGIDVDLLRLRRNGGGAEGFHYGVREALAGDPDWIWLMDDDCEPADDALERLLAARAARRPDTTALAPAARPGPGAGAHRLQPAGGPVRLRVVRRPARPGAGGPGGRPAAARGLPALRGPRVLG